MNNPKKSMMIPIKILYVCIYVVEPADYPNYKPAFRSVAVPPFLNDLHAMLDNMILNQYIPTKEIIVRKPDDKYLYACYMTEFLIKCYCGGIKKYKLERMADLLERIIPLVSTFRLGGTSQEPSEWITQVTNVLTDISLLFREFASRVSKKTPRERSPKIIEGKELKDYLSDVGMYYNQWLSNQRLAGGSQVTPAQVILSLFDWLGILPTKKPFRKFLQ